MNYDELSDDIRGRTGQFKTTCSNCIKEGKTNAESDLSLSINTDVGVYKCHRCGVSGHQDVEVDSLTLAKESGLTEEGYMFLYRRGFSDETIKTTTFRMDSTHKSIAIPYTFNKHIVKTKFRSLDGKTFTSTTGGMKVLHNHDEALAAVLEGEPLIICEGEFDDEAFRDIGFVATSVDMGAPNAEDKKVDGKLECIETSFTLIEAAETIYIAVDNDPNGLRLEKELILRCDPAKCKVVDFTPFKDANDVLLYEGKESLLERLKSAKEVKVEGVYTGEEDRETMKIYWDHGQPKGETTYIPEIDEIWTWRKTDINLLTGYMNEGKSSVLRYLALIKSVKEGVKWAVYAKEDYPRTDLYTDLIEMYVGMTTDIDKSYRRMTEKQYWDAYDFVRKHFILFQPEGKPNVFELNKFATFCKRKYGIFGAWYDPYIGIKHDMSKSGGEHLYISDFASEVKDCAIKNDIVITVVAHQRTPNIIDNIKSDNHGCYPRPNVYTIKGGGTWADAFDNVNSAWRPRYAVDKANPLVIFESQKIKKQKLVGRPGKVNLIYDGITSRFNVNGKNPLDIVEKTPEGLEKPLVNSNLDDNIQRFLNQSR